MPTDTPSVPPGEIQVRPFAPGDRDAVLGLAARLAAGVAPWRDPGAFARAGGGWGEASRDATGADAGVFVAEGGRGGVAGFVSVSGARHFTGRAQAHVGEPAVAASAEGMGVGRALMGAAEAWARGRGYGLLSLETGAANARARGSCEALGYAEEEVRLTKVLGD